MQEFSSFVQWRVTCLFLPNIVKKSSSIIGSGDSNEEISHLTFIKIWHKDKHQMIEEKFCFRCHPKKILDTPKVNGNYIKKSRMITNPIWHGWVFVLHTQSGNNVALQCTLWTFIQLKRKRGLAGLALSYWQPHKNKTFLRHVL